MTEEQAQNNESAAHVATIPAAERSRSIHPKHMSLVALVRYLTFAREKTGRDHARSRGYVLDAIVEAYGFEDDVEFTDFVEAQDEGFEEDEIASRVKRRRALRTGTVEIKNVDARLATDIYEVCEEALNAKQQPPQSPAGRGSDDNRALLSDYERIRIQRLQEIVEPLKADKKKGK